GAAQHPRDGTRRHTQLGTDPLRPAAMDPPAVNDPLGHLPRRPARAAVGTTGAIMQPELTLLVITLKPVVGALARDAHRLGGMSHRPPLLAHPLHQQQASLKRQTGITVGHDALRDVAVTVNQPHLTRRSSSRQRPATGVSPPSWPGTARSRRIQTPPTPPIMKSHNRHRARAIRHR